MRGFPGTKEIRLGFPSDEVWAGEWMIFSETNFHPSVNDGEFKMGSQRMRPGRDLGLPTTRDLGSVRIRSLPAKSAKVR